MSWFPSRADTGQSFIKDLLAKELEVARTEAEIAKRQFDALNREHAILQAQFEWLTTHVNRLETERQVLLERVMGLTLPAPTFEYQRGPSPATSSPPNKLSDADAPPQNIPHSDEYLTSIPALQALGSTFEDVGDDQAQLLGIGHGPTGDVTYRR